MTQIILAYYIVLVKRAIAMQNNNYLSLIDLKLKTFKIK